jgi:hypothetical protein
MKTAFLISLVLLLGACSTVPVKQQFPEVPTTLLEVCPDLNIAPDNTTSIAELLKVVVSNYQLYYECQNRSSAWQEWYQKQKKIFEKANK